MLTRPARDFIGVADLNPAASAIERWELDGIEYESVLSWYDNAYNYHAIPFEDQPVGHHSGYMYSFKNDGALCEDGCRCWQARDDPQLRRASLKQLLGDFDLKQFDDEPAPYPGG